MAVALCCRLHDFILLKCIVAFFDQIKIKDNFLHGLR
jgi:hypothetical protein